MVFAEKSVERIDEEPGYGAVVKEFVRKVGFASEVVVDERRATGRPRHDVQTPIRFRVVVRFALVAERGIETARGIGVKVEPVGFEFGGKVREQHPRLVERTIENLERVDVAHVRNFTEDLVGERLQGPIGLPFLVLQDGEQFLAVGFEADALLIGFLDPHANVAPGNVEVFCAHADVVRALAPDEDAPVFEHGRRRTVAEVHKFKKLDLVALRTQDHFVLVLVDADLKSDVVERNVENRPELFNDFVCVFVRLVFGQGLPQAGLRFGERSPSLRRAVSEGRAENGQRRVAAAPLDEFFRVFVARPRFERFLEVGECPVLLFQVEVGVGHAEVPAMVASEIRLMGFEERDGVLEHVAVVDRRRIAVGASELGIEFGRAFVVRKRFDRIDDLAEFVLFGPDLALLQEVHSFPPRFAETRRLRHAVADACSSDPV